MDWKIREEHLKDLIHLTFPLVLGWDLPRVVKGIGSSVSRFRMGNEVFSRGEALQPHPATALKSDPNR